MYVHAYFDQFVYLCDCSKTDVFLIKRISSMTTFFVRSNNYSVAFIDVIRIFVWIFFYFCLFKCLCLKQSIKLKSFFKADSFRVLRLLQCHFVSFELLHLKIKFNEYFPTPKFCIFHRKKKKGNQIVVNGKEKFEK